MEAWERLFPAIPFRALVRLYSIPPRVMIDTGEVFCLARPVPVTMARHLIVQERIWWDAPCDCWFVTLLAGDLRAVWAHIPERLPYACWCRSKTSSLFFYPIERIRKLMEATHGR